MCPLFSNKEAEKEKLLEGKLFILNNELVLKGSNVVSSLLTHVLEGTKKPAGDGAGKHLLGTEVT